MICYNCFQEKGENTVCPHCQYDSSGDRDRFPMALESGIEIGGAYTLGRVLGQGGFGITYIAKDNATGTRVAIKEYFPDSMATRTSAKTVSPFTGERGEGFLYGRQCFLEEAKTLATFIGNPNIVRVYRFFEENGTAYFVMEFVEGTSLKDYLRQHGGKISFEEAKQILVPVMDALAVVHSKGIIHRDISPDNILIKKSGRVKLLDFGAARYSIGDKSRSLDVVLKHGYAPREQYSRHGRQGPYTDVYSLAATFYRAITGVIPQDSIDRLDNDMLVTPRAYCPDLTPQGEYALYKALAVRPEDRFRSTTEFRDAMLSRGAVPAAHFRPAPASPVYQPPAGSSGNPSFRPPAVRSGNPPAPPAPYAAPRSGNPPVPPVQYTAPRSGNPPIPAARTGNPSLQPPPVYPAAAQTAGKPQKTVKPLKTALISFGISMAVFGIILLIILLLRK